MTNARTSFKAGRATAPFSCTTRQRQRATPCRLVRLFLLLAVLSLQACALHPRSPDARLPAAERLASADVQVRTADVLLLGDTQEHNIEGLPHGFITGIVDKVFADVTIRPPQHALFGRKLLEAIASGDAKGRPPIVHLGDLTDHSCEIEMSRMFDAIRRTNVDVTIAPGNHDGMFQGIFNPPDITSHWGFSSLGWDYVCRHANERNRISDKYGVQHPKDQQVESEPPVSNLMSKDRYIHAYLKLLQERNLIGPGATCADLSTLRCHEGDGFIARAYARIVPRQTDCGNAPKCRNFSESFLVQEVRLTDASSSVPVRLVLLDSTELDFLFVPSFDAVLGSLFNTKVNPGTRGYIGQRQLEVLQRIADRARDSSEVLVFGGHHDWLHLEPKSREALAAIFKKLPHPIVYLSAHTHRGFWAEHEFDGATMIEFNVSSLADWPIDARRVSFSVSKDRKAIEVTAGPAARGDARGDGELLAAWENELCRHPQTRAVLDDPAKFVEANRRIVQEHHEHSGTWLSMIGAFFVRLVVEETDVERNFQYTDNLNDARRALDSFAALLENSNTFDKWIETLPFSIYIHKSCVAKPNLASRLRCQVKRSEIPNRRRPEGVRQTFVYLSSTLRDLQRVVDSANMQTTPGITRAMACAHAVAAHADWQNQARPHFVYDYFFQPTVVARKK